MFKRIALVALFIASAGANCTAGIIGPAMTTDTIGQGLWGIEFTALTNGTLDGFDYHNLGLAGSYYLRDTTAGNAIVFTQSHGLMAPNISVTGANISLLAGHVYNLLGEAGGLDNGRFAAFTGFPVNDSVISVTSGVFSTNATDTNFWGAFNNLQTTSLLVAVPEPATASLLGLGTMIGAFCQYRRRKRSV